MLDALLALAGLIKEGKVRVKEDVAQGIAQVPEAFFRMLRGENEGKQLVKLIED